MGVLVFHLIVYSVAHLTLFCVFVFHWTFIA